jgi:hypothetical protein
MVVDMVEGVVAAVEVEASMVEVASAATGAGTPEDIGAVTLGVIVVEFLELIGPHMLGRIGVGTLERIGLVPLEGIEADTLAVPIVLLHFQVVPS